MTTKEFVRRSDEFSKLNLCPYLKQVGLITSCYRITLIQVLATSVIERFDIFPSLASFSTEELESCQSLYIEFYSFSQFQIDLGYFKSFYNRLSEYQRKSLLASHKVDFLLRYCGYESFE